jgi:hypothetical protein
MARLIQKMKIRVRRFSPVRTNCASLVSSPGPFDLDGSDWTLNVSLDQGAFQQVDILHSAFSTPSNVSDTEMAAVIHAAITGGESYTDADGAVVVGTETQGGSGSIEISGDAVSDLLGFQVITSVGSGFDDVFGGLKPVNDGTQEGTTRRREQEPVVLVCQVDRNNWGSRKMSPGGYEEQKKTVFTVERRRLASKGLINERGVPKINIGDRVSELLDMSGNLVESFDDPNGLWIHHVGRAGHGLKAWGNRTNRLYFLECSEDRVTG